jgi:hypothetical protein
VVSNGAATGIVEASKGIVTEVGIADKAFTKTAAARKTLLASVK